MTKMDRQTKKNRLNFSRFVDFVNILETKAMWVDWRSVIAQLKMQVGAG